jgi:hypothetical protein
MVAFKATAAGFEFVVSSRGIGALQSLRTCSDDAHLADHGQALSLARRGLSQWNKHRPGLRLSSPVHGTRESQWELALSLGRLSNN